MLNLRCMALRVISVLVCCHFEALKELRFKMIEKCLEKVKIFEWPVLPYSFSPIDCSVRKTVRKTQNLISISNHRFLENQTGDWLVKVMGFLTDLKVYNIIVAWAKSRILFQNLRQSYRIPLKCLCHKFKRVLMLSITWIISQNVE